MPLADGAETAERQYAQKSLTETAESAEVGDRLTQIHWIYKIFLRKSAISARDYLYKEQSLPTHNRASGCRFSNIGKSVLYLLLRCL